MKIRVTGSAFFGTTSGRLADAVLSDASQDGTTVDFTKARQSVLRQGVPLCGFAAKAVGLACLRRLGTSSQAGNGLRCGGGGRDRRRIRRGIESGLVREQRARSSPPVPSPFGLNLQSAYRASTTCTTKRRFARRLRVVGRLTGSPATNIVVSEKCPAWLRWCPPKKRPGLDAPWFHETPR